MGNRPANPQAAIPLGVCPDRQLRIADRAGRGLAAADPWRRAGAEIFDRRGPARQARPVTGAGALERTAAAARTVRARRLRAERGLYVRRDAAQRSDHPAVRGIGHLLQLRDDEGLGVAAGNVLNPERDRVGQPLIAPSITLPPRIVAAAKGEQKCKTNRNLPPPSGFRWRRWPMAAASFRPSLSIPTTRSCATRKASSATAPAAARSARSWPTGGTA